MKNTKIIFAAFAITALSGCQSIPVAKDAAKMELSFNWPNNAPCFGPSPTFNLANVPKETKFLQFNMRDLNATYRHGGGTVEYTGGNSIPEAALKDYAGPCPPGVTHTYEITVKALNANKDLIIGEGVSRRKFPE
jgi:phosphatidylethanolamine-binding protein (PEBP) family uncharacterized protein